MESVKKRLTEFSLEAHGESSTASRFSSTDNYTGSTITVTAPTGAASIATNTATSTTTTTVIPAQ